MKSAFLLAQWHALPRPLALHLLHGSAEAGQCLKLGTLALEMLCAGEKIPAALALDFLLAAWEAHPENAALARQLLDLPSGIADLGPARRAVLTALCAAPHDPDAWPPALKSWRQASIAWTQGKIPEALRCFLRVGEPWLTPLERAGHCLMRLGDREAALRLWRRVLKKRPWHVQLSMILYDYQQGHDRPLPAPPGPTAALFYSWNKADDLHAALQSLEASLDDVALVACLDNGSTDSTPDVLRFWHERLGERFLPVRLPVNIGAAAARNWLASLPQVRALPFAAYIDDDALLPPHWLRHLARAQSLYPHAAVWGCHVADADAPHTTQCGPLHLVPQFAPPQNIFLPGQPDSLAPHHAVETAFSPFLAKGEPFAVSDHLCAGMAHESLAFVRPCASVTGCCHLLRTRELTEHPFNLALSPSQYDDLERDLRMLSLGRTACYTGFCTVRHAKRTGGAGSLAGPAYGNALGNRYKLHGMYDADTLTAMARTEAEVLEADLLARFACLEVEDSLC